MNDDLFVSIIINNYNYDRFLSEAIDSALSQSYAHVEVIVVDDGSTDSSREIIAKYGDRIIPLFQPNGKQATAFNNGFSNCRGDIILFLDSDDYLLPTAVERIVSVWHPHLAKVHYRLAVVDTTGESLGYSFPQGTQPLETGQVWRTLLEFGGYVSTPTSGNALNRKAMEQIFPIPDEYQLTADDYLSILIPFYGEVAAIEDPLGAYRIHDSNQWALATVTSARFRRFVCHDLQNYALLVKKANELEYDIPEDLEQRSIGRLWSRIISLKLEPQEHPVPNDRLLTLTFMCLRSLWKYSQFSPQKQLLLSLWVISVSCLPLPLAKVAITWLFVPNKRPTFRQAIQKFSNIGLGNG